MQQLSDQVKFNNRKPHAGKKPTQGVIGPNKVGCWVQTPLTAPRWLKTSYTTKSGQVKNRYSLNPASQPITFEDGTVKKIVHFVF